MEHLGCAQKTYEPQENELHSSLTKNDIKMILNQGVKYKIIDEDYSTLEYFMYVHNIYLEPK